MSGEMKRYEMTFTQRLVVEAASIEEMEAAAKGFQAAVPLLSQFALGVTETEDKGDGRWVVVGGKVERLPLLAASIEELRQIEAPAGEFAKISTENASYVYQPQLDPAMAKGIDIRFIVASKHGGVWIEVGYLQRLMMQQQQAQHQQPQQMRPQGGAPRAR